MEHYEEVLKILHDKFDWKLTDSLTTTGKKLVSDTIKALKIAENNQALQLQQTGVSISLVRAKKYARHQHFLGTQGKELVEFEDWKQD